MTTGECCLTNQIALHYNPVNLFHRRIRYALATRCVGQGALSAIVYGTEQSRDASSEFLGRRYVL